MQIYYIYCFRFVQIIFFFLGLGTLLPWNFFITAIPYFEAQLNIGNVSTSRNATEQVVDQWHFSNWMTLLAMLPLLLFTCLNSILYPRISEKFRIAGSLFGILLLFLVTAVMVMVPLCPKVFFGITMTVIWFINSFGAVLQGSLFGLVGLLPAKYSSLFMSGQGVAGMFAALASILAKISGADERTVALGYFITPCLVILLTIIFYFTLPHLKFAKYHFKKDQLEHCYEPEAKLEMLAPLAEKNGVVEKGQQVLVHLERSHSKEDRSERSFSVVKVFRKIWKLAIAVCLIFTVTISVFPAITAHVSSKSEEGKWREYFIPVCCFLLFNIMDWAGRSVTALSMWPQKDNVLLLSVLLRVIFIPIFMMCNVKERHILPIVFEHDGWFILFMFLFAFSNGYLVTLCMCYAPKKVSPRDAETAGAVMAFFLALGLALGAAVSFPIRLML
ncbi:equilibrative nucleoside transporter 2-like [Carcharodon carcharias]|uniref:equilibrative nucleoside transporter 2-like n=1 Tax=Carcharodon carcharias TaxID=13397 RepID=UPI001B7DD1C2|nr:equilibrative nucleoside transporter 2-like [Carcharodon carcharias]